MEIDEHGKKLKLWVRRKKAGLKLICSRCGQTAHGSALTPDETELWISDQVGKKLWIYDATQMPPKEQGIVSCLRVATVGSTSAWMAVMLDAYTGCFRCQDEEADRNFTG